MRKSPRRQLEFNLVALLRAGNSTNVRLDGMSVKELKNRIADIVMWDSLRRFTCPMCETASIRLDSKAKAFLNLRCSVCGAKYEMSISRSLGAHMVVR